MRLDFTKMSAHGNDFVLIEDEGDVWGASASALARALCVRRTGIGADGLLLIRRVAVGRVSIRYHNADGSWAGLCANGARCAALRASQLGWSGEEVTLETGVGPLEASVTASSVRLSMPRPSPILERNIAISSEAGHPFWCVNTGVPHAVRIVESPEDVDFASVAPRVRAHPDLGPGGANVDLAWRDCEGSIRMRSWERGVEGETSACGTGAVAVALAFAARDGGTGEFCVRTSFGEDYRVRCEGRAPHFRAVSLEGTVAEVFRGRVVVPSPIIPDTQI